jgi:hypothetical protein
MSSKSKEPSAPSVEDTSAKSIQAQINSLPEMLKAQEQYGPQFTQQYLNEMKQYAPQIMGFQREMEAQYTPELTNARKVLDDYFQQNQELTPYEERQAKETFRGAQASRGMAQTGMGAQEELRGLTNLRQQLKSQRLGLAIQMAGMGSPQTAALTTMSPVANLGLQNVTPGNVFGLTQTNYAGQMGAFGQAAQGRGDLMGSLIGLGGQLGMNYMTGGMSGATSLGASSGSGSSGNALYANQSSITSGFGNYRLK